MSEFALTVVLVGCSASKLDRAAPARDLYTSALFRKARAYAEASGCPWAILSAKHGLVLPETVLEPYDLSFKTASSTRARDRWGAATQKQIRAQWPVASFVLLAGRDYGACLSHCEPGVTEPLEYFAPLEGKGVGERLAWLRRETERLGGGAFFPSKWDRPEGCRCVSAKVHEGNGHCDSLALGLPEVEEAECDFCGERVATAVSELGHQRFEGDDTPARICGSCATWALEQLRGVPA